MRSQRKDEHVALALAQKDFYNDFQRMQLFHQSLPSFDLEEVNLETNYFGHHFSTPIYINAMTGGSKKTKEINAKLAELAKRYGLAMAVGSQHAALDDAELEESFKIVRQVNPQGFILANVSANASVERACRAVDMIQANALQIHINPAQEVTMDEGDRHFKHWLNNIKDIVQSLDVPVIVKEVGNGMSFETVEKLKSVGVQYIDLSGRGGTNFIWIENQRSEAKRYDYLMDWGLTAMETLIENKEAQKDTEILVSGGIKTPLDVIKALVLGSKAVGMSSTFLKWVENDREEEVAVFLEDLKKVMVLIDIQNVKDLPLARYKIKD